MFRIKEINLLNEYTIRIRWSDTSHTVVNLCQLQAHCPCARCQQQMSKLSAKKVGAKAVRLVGNYGLKISFTSGCSSGVYPVAWIKKTFS